MSSLAKAQDQQDDVASQRGVVQLFEHTAQQVQPRRLMRLLWRQSGRLAQLLEQFNANVEPLPVAV